MSSPDRKALKVSDEAEASLSTRQRCPKDERPEPRRRACPEMTEATPVHTAKVFHDLPLIAPPGARKTPGAAAESKLL